MISTDFKISLRRLIREKQYSIINIAGLATSMAGALLIILYLQFELSYDRYHPDHQNIYRLAVESEAGGEKTQMAVNALPLAPLMESYFSEFTNFTRIFPVNFFFRNVVYRYEDKNFFEGGVFAADSTFFDLFHFDFVHGQASNALTEPFSIVMTRSMAEKYFGDINPVGETILVEGAGGFQVTAVIEDPPNNSHLQFDGMLSITTLQHLTELLESAFGRGARWEMFEQAMLSRISWVYVKTVEGFDPETFLQEQWGSFYRDHLQELEASVNMRSRLIFQPIHSIHLESKMMYEMTSETGATTMMSPEMVRIFFLIALFLLTISSINYTNLAISRFSKRSKEVGVRKVMGASKSQLVKQFMTESVLTTLAALLIALLLVEIVLPTVNNLLGVAISANVFANPQVLLILFGMAVFVGLVAGVYPSVYFTSFSPIKVLAHGHTPGKATLSLKKALIVLQFVISIFMVTATLVVNSQLRFINNKNLGYDHDHVMIIEMQDTQNINRAESLMNMLQQNPSIVDAAVSNYYPSIYTVQNSLEIDTDDGHERFNLNYVQVSADFIGFMDMELLKGRFFDWENRTDIGEAVIINEAAWRQIGWEDPIGKTIYANYEMVEESVSGRRVIGVMKDFHYASLNKPIEPLMMFPMENRGSFLLAKLPGNDIPAGIAAVESAWREFAPNNPLVYFFLDQTIAGLYESQRVLSKFFGAFALLCIIIAFMGVYGLSAYAAEQRTREISIRKVLGATLKNVLVMLHKEFSWLLIIAFVLASVPAYYLLGLWLDGFAYRISLPMWPFVVAGLVAFMVTLLAVGYHAWQSMRRNTAETLQYE